jgi:Fe-S-cluster containining protein
MGLGRVEFVERFLERDGPVWAVKSGADGYCLFYEPLDRACLIEPMKPLSCLAWPFYRWPLGGPGAFAEAQNLCPALAELEWPDYLAAFEAAGAGGPPPKSLKEATLGYRGGGRFFA